MKKINKKIGLNFLIFGIVIMYCSFVSAGVAIMSQYGKEVPLIVAPGGEEILKIGLMNIEDTEKDIIVRAELLDNAGIASFVDSNLEYTLPYAQSIPVDVEISIPGTAAEGTDYMLQFRFTDITPSGETGTVILGSASKTSIAVRAQSPPKPPVTTEQPAEEGLGATWLLLLVIVIVAVIAIIYFIIKNRRNKPAGKEAKKPEKPEKEEKPEEEEKPAK